MKEINIAIPLFCEALDLLQQLGDTAELAALLESIARLPLDSHDPISSVKLFAEGKALHRIVGDALTPHHTKYIQTSLATARQQLGETVYQKAWDQRTNQTVDQAIAMAYKVLGRKK